MPGVGVRVPGSCRPLPASAAQVIKFDGKALIDMFSLADVAGLAGAEKADVTVEGSVDEERKAAVAAAAAARAASGVADVDDEDDE